MTTTFAFGGTVVVVVEVVVVEVMGVVGKGVSLHPTRNKIKRGSAMRGSFFVVSPF